MNEKWKSIKSFDSYQISDFGNVRSLNYNKTGKINLLKQKTTSDGYNEILLCKNSKYKTFKVHRLVAINFINNYEKKPQVNHINGNKTDNNVNNLEWVTASENLKHRYRTLKHPAVNSKKVLCVDTGEVFDSGASAARSLGLTITCVRDSIRRGHKAGGYNWGYI